MALAVDAMLVCHAVTQLRDVTDFCFVRVLRLTSPLLSFRQYFQDHVIFCMDAKVYPSSTFAVLTRLQVQSGCDETRFVFKSLSFLQVVVQKQD